MKQSVPSYNWRQNGRILFFLSVHFYLFPWYFKSGKTDVFQLRSRWFESLLWHVLMTLIFKFFIMIMIKSARRFQNLQKICEFPKSLWDSMADQYPNSFVTLDISPAVGCTISSLRWWYFKRPVQVTNSWQRSTGNTKLLQKYYVIRNRKKRFGPMGVIGVNVMFIGWEQYYASLSSQLKESTQRTW